jgi:hypothetical protein
MKHIKKFESKEKSIYQEDFEIGKRETVMKIDELLEVFGDFINDVSPRHWRRTGHFYTELESLKSEIESFTPMTSEESEINWVKDQRFKEEKPSFVRTGRGPGKA